MSEKIIAIGDVHGCVEELKILLHQLPLDQNTTLVFLGDYVDRGPDSKGVIDAVLNVSELFKVVTLKGNHEWMFEEFLKNPNDSVVSSNFILNGGSSTLASYSEDGVRVLVPDSHRDFLEKLQIYYSTEKHFFVHAGVPPGFDFSAPVDEKTKHQMLWIRSTFLECQDQWAKTVVHGHTPVHQPELLPHRINLDTGCVFGRSLTAMDISNQKIYSVLRNQAADPKFLTSTFKGRTRAQRFEGEIAVDVRQGSVSFAFKTVNFNEFGMLISPVPGAPTINFQKGQAISGFIKTGGDSNFEFRGTVMRLEEGSGAISKFAVKFDALENLKEPG